MNTLTTAPRTSPRQTWCDLITTIVESYHNSLRAALPCLEGLADQIARERRLPIRVLDGLLREFSVLADSLRAHLLQQEGHLFPMIRHVCESVEQAGWACHLDDDLEELMDEATRADQEAMASALRAETCLSGADAMESGPLVCKLVKGFRELREDLEEHVKLETTVLFPIIRELLRGNDQRMERPFAASRADPLPDTPAVPDAPGPAMDTIEHRDQPSVRAVKSILHALRDRLSVDQAITLGSHLPRPVRRVYYEDWQQRWDPVTKTPNGDFLRGIAESLPEEGGRDAEQVARSVFGMLARQMPPQEAVSVRDALPKEVRPLWPGKDSTPSTAELIIADQETG